MPDLSILAFSSDENYLKRDPLLEGNAAVTLPVSESQVTYTVDHNFGYIPFVYVGADVDDDGIIWSNQKVHIYTGTSVSGISASQIEEVLLYYWVSTTQLGIVLDNQTTTEAGQQRRVYWAIYKDYGDV